MKKLFSILVFATLLASIPAFAAAEDCTVSVVSTEEPCTESDVILEKALLQVKRAERDVANARRDAVHIYEFLGGMFIVCLLLFGGFLGRGRRIEELEDEIVSQRIELGRLTPRGRADVEEGTPY